MKNLYLNEVDEPKPKLDRKKQTQTQIRPKEF